jgi:hypothetical protein
LVLLSIIKISVLSVLPIHTSFGEFNMSNTISNLVTADYPDGSQLFDPSKNAVPVAYNPAGNNLIAASATAMEASGIAKRTPYMGMASGRCRVPAIIIASIQMFSRTRHIATDTVRNPVVAWANWYAPAAAGETLVGATSQYRCSIEYPVGTYTQLKSNGNATMTVADGATGYFDAPTSLTIPAGATYFIRVWVSSSTNMLYTLDGLNNAAGVLSDTGETTVITGGAVTDDTMTGVNPNNSLAYLVLKPVAILSMTTRPTFFQLVDSKGDSGDLASDITGTVGETGRSIGTKYGAILSSVSGETLSTAITRYTNSRRLALAAFCSHIISDLGINDVSGGRTVAQMGADLVSLIAIFGKKTWFHTTLVPLTTATTNGYGDVAGQTTSANNANRVGFNNKIRAGAYNIDYYCELADVMEILDSGRQQNEKLLTAQSHLDRQL